MLQYFLSVYGPWVTYVHFVYLVVVIAIPFLGRVLVYNKFGALLPSWFLSVPILIFFFQFSQLF